MVDAPRLRQVAADRVGGPPDRAPVEVAVASEGEKPFIGIAAATKPRRNDLSGNDAERDAVAAVAEAVLQTEAFRRTG